MHGPFSPSRLPNALSVAQDGQPLGGAWAQVAVDLDGQVLTLDAAAQVHARQVDLAQFPGGSGGSGLGATGGVESF